MRNEIDNSIAYTKLYGWLILAITIIGLIVSASHDMSLSSQFSFYADSNLVHLLDRSIFDGGGLGISDIPIILNLSIVFLGLLASFIKILPERLKLYAKYCAASNLIFGVIIVHGLKFVIGRARPHVSLSDSSYFTTFFEFGRHRPFIDSFSGSLPSGHTAAMMALIPIVFCIFDGPSFKGKLLRGIGIIGTVSGALLMAIGRVSSKDHFLSDCLLSIFLGWNFHFFTYYIYFKVPVLKKYDIYSIGFKNIAKLTYPLLALLLMLLLIKII